jgi:hypothetical protein
MIRKDHLIDRPRHLDFTYICSVGTIRVGILSCTPNYEMLEPGYCDYGLGAIYTAAE